MPWSKRLGVGVPGPFKVGCLSCFTTKSTEGLRIIIVTKVYFVTHV